VKLFPFFTKASEPEESKSSNTYELIDLQSATGLSSLGTGMNETQALQITAVQCCVRVLAEGCASMPMEIKQEQVDGERWKKVRVPDHPLTNLVRRKPNNHQTPYQFVESGTLIAALYGEFIALKDRARSPNNLYPVVPGDWQRVITNNGVFYDITLRDQNSPSSSNGTVTKRYPESLIFSLKGPSFNGIDAFSPISLARSALSLSLSIEKGQSVTAKDGARPSGILSTENRLSKEAKEHLSAQWQSKFGENGTGGIAVLDQSWEFSDMKLTSVDSTFLDTRRFQIEEIARAFRVFPQMLMQTDKTATFASAESFFRAHVTHSLGPWVRRWSGAATLHLLSPADRATGHFVSLDEEELLKADPQVMGEYYAKALGSGNAPAWMSQDEVREKRGLNSVGGPAAELPKQATEQPKPSPEPPGSKEEDTNDQE